MISELFLFSCAAPFGDMARCLQNAGVGPEKVAGVLLDLGISSPQLDGGRGFRPEVDAPLDMVSCQM